jgi:hypothetical protein
MTITSSKQKPTLDIFVALAAIPLCIDLLTPYLIWQDIIPSALRWVSHIAIALMIIIAFFRMIVFNHIPRAVWFIIGIVIVWSYIASGNGQSLAVTIWGNWLLFQFPFVCVFIYLQPSLPQNFAQYILKFGLIVLGLQVTLQLIQYSSGVIPGDDLSGLFGKNGTGNAVLFDILICCVFFGHWIVTRKWEGLFSVLALSSISSVLGEMKLFPLAISVIGLLSIAIYAIKYHAPVRFIVYLCSILITLFGFIYLYNIIVPGAKEFPLQAYLTNPEKLINYLNRSASYFTDKGLYTDIGRVYALQVGWNSLQRDPLTFLFGYGIGARSESQTFGTTGVALAQGDLGLSVGTSILVIMQEMGFLGLTLLVGFILCITVTVIRDINKNPNSQAAQIRYGILFFSLLLPLWLWYAMAWTMRVPMFLYWGFLGYVLAESHESLGKQKDKVLNFL